MMMIMITMMIFEGENKARSAAEERPRLNGPSASSPPPFLGFRCWFLLKFPFFPFFPFFSFRFGDFSSFSGKVRWLVGLRFSAAEAEPALHRAGGDFSSALRVIVKKKY